VSGTIYRGFMPEKPDESWQVVETGGLGPVHAMSAVAGAAVEEVAGVQLVRRSATYQKARADMNVAWKTLDGAGDRTINGTRYLWIEATQSPFALGRDETSRPLMACNFLVCKALSTSTST
jgi:hypothetical protein